MRKREIELGEQFYQLKVIDVGEPIIDKSGRKHETFLCECTCGATKVVRKGYLLQGDVKSCGCRQRNVAPKSTQEIVKIGQRFGNLEVVDYQLIGIVFLEHINKWQASIKDKTGIKYIGTFNTFDEAVEKYRGWLF